MNLIERRYGFPVLGVHVSNRGLDRTSMSGIAPIRFPIESVNQEVDLLNKENNVPFYYLQESESLTALCTKLERDFLNLPYGVI